MLQTAVQEQERLDDLLKSAADAAKVLCGFTNEEFHKNSCNSTKSLKLFFFK